MRPGPGDLCHPTLSRYPFTREGWLFELKHDGYRACVQKFGAEIAILSRWGTDLSACFPELVEALASAPDAVLDAELLVPNERGRSDFAELRRRALLQRPRMIDQAAIRRPAVLMIFDVLHASGQDLRQTPLTARRAWLRHAIVPRAGVQVIEGVETHGEAIFASVCDQDLEGVVAKRLEAAYGAGRHSSWVKIKNQRYSRQGAVRWRP